jgi:hypothetical protein
MARDLATPTAVAPIMGEDGVVYFQHVPMPTGEQPKPVTERLCQWTLVFLWSLVPVVASAAMLWF